jgi:two-component system, OmpR family, sensor histidine kinase KdpD
VAVRPFECPAQGYARAVTRRTDSELLRQAPSQLLGLGVALLAVAATTLVIYPLREVAPAVSTGVLYLLAVLLVSTFWGLRLGLLTAVLSALAFNFFHIPPIGRFTISTGENWVALVVLLIVAIAASNLAELARSRAVEADERRREADLSAELARVLLGGQDVDDAAGVAAQRIAGAFSLPSAALHVGPGEPPGGRTAFPLSDGGRRLGTLVLPDDLDAGVSRRIQQRVVPPLEALLAAAVRREELQREVVETAALRRSDVLKTTLLRTVSHDLRSPLTGIVAAGEAVASPTLTQEEREEMASVIATEAARMSRLVENLLDLSRLQAGAAEPRKDWTSVEELLRSAMEESSTGPESFTTAIDRELPLVRADAVQLERAFANLLENGVRHSHGHPVSVRARAVGTKLVVRVVDRGPGIGRAEQERIFQPFYVAGEPRLPHGSGLGLAIVRGFVEANGGTVRVESLPGQGTSFVVELPLEPQLQAGRA